MAAPAVFFERDSMSIENPKTTRELMVQLLEALKQHSEEFYQIFHVKLKDYWSLYTGFDIVEFNRQIIKSGEDAPAKVLKEKFGENGHFLIEKLLDYPKLGNSQGDNNGI